jgi:flagellar biosynthesis GTPase FlhF
MDDLQEILKQYKLSKTGDMNAIRCILSNMGDGKLLKSDLSFELKCLLELAEQSDESAYKTLYALKEVNFENKPLYFEPDYIRKEKKLAEKAQILAEAKAWKENVLAKNAAKEKAAEEKAQKDAERERKRLEREQKRLEEEARKRAEEEERELAVVSALRDKAFDTLKSIVENMIHITGDTFLMGSPGDKLNLPHKETVPDFWLSKRTIRDVDMENLLFEEYSCTSIDVVRKFIKRLSLILECPFDLPPASSLEYAFRGGENYTIDNIINTKLLDVVRNGVEWTSTIIGKNDIRISISSSSRLSFKTFGSASFRLYCTDSKIEEIQRRYKELAEEKKRQAEEERRLAAEEKRRAEEERKKAQEKWLLQLKQQQLTIQQEKEAKLKEEWNALVDSFLNDVETFEYESGFLFNKKKVQVRYLRRPITYRLKNAIIQKDSLIEWEKQDTLMMQKNQKKSDHSVPDPNWNVTNIPELNRFLNKLNEYKGSVCTFDFLHNNKDVEERLRKSGKIGTKGAYLIIK